MSKTGELLFLRSKPQFVSDLQMRKYCSGNAAANNKNGFIEQGCYVPNSSNSSRGNIYIREMPANLYDQEIVTAAYEMLHTVFFKIGIQNSSLVQAVEANYANLHNNVLTSQVNNFAITEPGYRDLELFSLLGTEFSTVTPTLANYYAPYFTNRSLTVNSYSSVTSTFQNEQNQLAQLKVNIAQEDSSANKAYADSLAWANVGNAYEDSYNYNIYKNYIAQENASISQYNQLSVEYNTLVTQYNGTQPVSTLSQVQTQTIK